MKVNSAKLVLCLLSLIGISVIPAFSQKNQNTKIAAAIPKILPAAESAARGLPLRRVILYKSGVGYFEHDGTVHGNEHVEISLTSSQLDDVLKSLTALDLTGGRISGATYNSQEPTAHQLQALSVAVADRGTLGSLLQELRGARIEVRNGSASFSGRLLSVEEKTRRENNVEIKTPEVSLMNDSGDVRQFPIGAETTLRFADHELEQELSRALGLMDASHAQDTRHLVLTATGDGARELRISYISEVPVWKTTYRIVLPPASQPNARPLLQGWAIVDNTVGEDWNDVELSLAAGAPQSFIQAISQPYYTRRPVVPMPEGFMMSPQLHAATLSSNAGEITGVIRDASGAAIAGASITVKDRNSNTAGTAKTDGSGRYRVTGLSDAAYTLEIARDGFQTTVVRNVAANGNNDNSYRMQVGATSLTVEVVSSAGAQLTDANEFAVDTREKFLALPAIARDGHALSLNEETFLAAARSIGSAQASSLGDLFEYKLKDRVTIHKNQSAIVPIVQTDLKAEKIALWNAGMDSPRPLRALWITNDSGLTLDGGSFSIVDASAFAGEGILDSIQPGERRIISYAADLAVQVAANSQEESEVFTRVRVAHGVMIRTTEVRERAVYTIRNEDAQPRTMVIEHPVRENWKLSPDVKPEESSADAHRFRVVAEPKHTTEFVVEESKESDAEISLTNLDSPTVDLYVREKGITPEVEAALRQVIAQKVAIAKLDMEIKSVQQDTEQVFKDQDRLRENLKSLKGTPEEKSLAQRYTRELDDQETRLETLRKQLADLRDQHKKAQDELNATIMNLTFDIKL
jgi:hypothetical protein